MPSDKCAHGVEEALLLLDIDEMAGAGQDLELGPRNSARDFFRHVRRRAEVVAAADDEDRLADIAEPRKASCAMIMSMRFTAISGSPGSAAARSIQAATYCGFSLA